MDKSVSLLGNQQPEIQADRFVLQDGGRKG